MEKQAAENKLNELLDTLVPLRKEFFGKDEDVYRLIGRAMGSLMDCRDIVRKQP